MSVTDTTLLGAALSALAGEVLTPAYAPAPDASENLNHDGIWSLDRLHSLTLRQPVASVCCKPYVSLFGTLLKVFSPVSKGNRSKGVAGKDSMALFVKTLTGKKIPVFVKNTDTVDDLMTVIEEKEGIPIDHQRLIFRGKQLEDSRSLADYGVQHGHSLFMSLRLRGGGEKVESKSIFDARYLDPNYDFDFTKVRDNGERFMRGGEPYSRPYGWLRYALKVLGRYEDDVWLGKSGCRLDASEGEWPVSYHGTSKQNSDSIAEAGYKASKCVRKAYGKGIYSSPDLATAAQFAAKFEHGGKVYIVVFQNRVNPQSLKKVPNITCGSVKDTEFWISPFESHIRPYGILIKLVQ